MIRRPRCSEANGRIGPGCRGYTPSLFERHPGIFNDRGESGSRFNVSSEGRCVSSEGRRKYVLLLVQVFATDSSNVFCM